MKQASDFQHSNALLSPFDPEPVEIINAHSEHPLVLLCEHAGQTIPTSLDGLGISQAALDSHIGWDIGAAAVTRQMAKTLSCPAVLQRYSRLLIDCNRPPEAADAMPETSDGTTIAGNVALTSEARAARVRDIFDPYQKAVELFMRQPARRIALSIHSFTPAMNGQTRPWEIGFLFRHDTQTSQQLAQLVQECLPELNIGMNEPYQVDDASDWFVPRHGEALGMAHSLIEIRNDQIDNAQGQAAWAATLATVVERYLQEN